MQERPRAFVILYRDLGRFCSALFLSDYRWRMSMDGESITHTVTLINPYENEGLPTKQVFYTRKLQETLAAPYRAELLGLPGFQIKGAIPKDLSAAVMAEITRSSAEDPERILCEVEKLKAKGNEYFRKRDGPIAAEVWGKALLQIHRLITSPSSEWREIRDDFFDWVAAVKFDLCSNSAQNYLVVMRETPGDTKLFQRLAPDFFQTIDMARRATEDFSRTTWEPSPHK